ncbi:MAG: hypothetical protein IJT44_04880 [Clostridia bacterium]|nr:hypothetical protein [Clostridia bacterium]
MNGTHFNQIVAHYIEKFEYINNKDYREYYKWEIAGRFRAMMDAALSASDEDLPKALSAAKKLSENLIDNYTQPFGGLVEFSKREPETVRRMFSDLYAEDGGSVLEKQNKIRDFLQKSHTLRDRYYPESFLYNDDFHSVSGYIFLYDPDHNYLYKYDQAKRFADCIEFMEDWGSGENTRLDIYYRMCDEVVARIKASSELLQTDASRFDTRVFANADRFHPDTEKHILCFDLIYCSTVYGLFHGISFESIPAKERKLFTEKVQKAQELKAAYDRVIEQERTLTEVLDSIRQLLAPGLKVTHKTFGEGTVVGIEGLKKIIIEFKKSGTKTLGVISTLCGGFFQTENEELNALVLQNKELLLSESKIPTRIKEAKRKLIPYMEYLT